MRIIFSVSEKFNSKNVVYKFKLLLHAVLKDY